MEYSPGSEASGSDPLAVSVAHLEAALGFADATGLLLLGAKISDALDSARCELELRRPVGADPEKAFVAGCEVPR